MARQSHCACSVSDFLSGWGRRLVLRILVSSFLGAEFAAALFPGKTGFTCDYVSHRDPVFTLCLHGGGFAVVAMAPPFFRQKAGRITDSICPGKLTGPTGCCVTDGNNLYYGHEMFGRLCESVGDTWPKSHLIVTYFPANARCRWGVLSDWLGACSILHLCDGGWYKGVTDYTWVGSSRKDLHSRWNSSGSCKLRRALLSRRMEKV